MVVGLIGWALFESPPKLWWRGIGVVHAHSVGIIKNGLEINGGGGRTATRGQSRDVEKLGLSPQCLRGQRQPAHSQGMLEAEEGF
jgi:hypothetical protein